MQNQQTPGNNDTYSCRMDLVTRGLPDPSYKNSEMPQAAKGHEELRVFYALHALMPCFWRECQRSPADGGLEGQISVEEE